MEKDKDIIGLCIHPTLQHMFVSTTNGEIHIIHVKNDNDNNDGEMKLEVIATMKNDGLTTTTSITTEEGSDVQFTCMGLHPDGLILALGRNDGNINLWDLTTEKLAITLEVSLVYIVIVHDDNNDDDNNNDFLFFIFVVNNYYIYRDQVNQIHPQVFKP